MSTSDVLSELEAIGAVGQADIKFEDPILEPASKTESTPTVVARPSIDERKIEELVGFCDKLLQVFGILARANTELTRTVEEMRDMINEFRSSSYHEEGNDPEDLMPPAEILAARPRLTLHPEEDEANDIPVDISGFDIPPNVPFSTEMVEEPSFPPPLARAPILPPSNMQPDPNLMDQALVEAAMREMGLRG